MRRCGAIGRCESAAHDRQRSDGREWLRAGHSGRQSTCVTVRRTAPAAPPAASRTGPGWDHRRVSKPDTVRFRHNQAILVAGGHRLRRRPAAGQRPGLPAAGAARPARRRGLGLAGRHRRRRAGAAPAGAGRATPDRLGAGRRADHRPARAGRSPGSTTASRSPLPAVRAGRSAPAGRRPPASRTAGRAGRTTGAGQ